MDGHLQDRMRLITEDLGSSAATDRMLQPIECCNRSNACTRLSTPTGLSTRAVHASCIVCSLQGWVGTTIVSSAKMFSTGSSLCVLKRLCVSKLYGARNLHLHGFLVLRQSIVAITAIHQACCCSTHVHFSVLQAIVCRSLSPRIVPPSVNLSVLPRFAIYCRRMAPRIRCLVVKLHAASRLSGRHQTRGALPTKPPTSTPCSNVNAVFPFQGVLQ